jgi:hypothetical protein
MRVSSALLAATIAAACHLPASATVRIASDPGGQIGPYLDKLQALERSGQSVMIDGPCLSACTMVLGVIPRDRICVTARARLGFHAAWRPDRAGRQTSAQDGTAYLMSHYPQQVRDWINRRGGLSQHLVYLSGEELASMYPHCAESHATATDWHPGRERGRSRVTVEHSQSVPAAHAATMR